jgi:hypothetical protein
MNITNKNKIELNKNKYKNNILYIINDYSSEMFYLWYGNCRQI